MQTPRQPTVRVETLYRADDASHSRTPIDLICMPQPDSLKDSKVTPNGGSRVLIMWTDGYVP
jgi:hypothetical protein